MEEHNVIHPETGISQEYRHLVKRPDKLIWVNLFATEFRRLAQGVGKIVQRTNTIFVVQKDTVLLVTKKVTCGKIVCDVIPQN